jgi:prepilin-type N-terminal cleavage/methylation domain-containing protein/prepilin-type processing-associated H-X9-DG protein
MRPQTTVRRNAFTLVELLVVVAIIGILAAFLFSALSNAKQQAIQLRCLGNHRELILGWRIYTSENMGVLVPDDPGTPNRPGSAGNTNYASWVYGLMTQPVDCTNLNLIREGLLYHFTPNVNVYRCPADQTDHTRSYAMQCQMAQYLQGVKYDGQAAAGINGHTPIYKDSQITRLPASDTMVFLDEDPNFINDGMFQVLTAGNDWQDAPATWHDGGDNLSYADGHVAHHKWQDPRTFALVHGQENSAPGSPDLQHVQQSVNWQ